MKLKRMSSITPAIESDGSSLELDTKEAEFYDPDADEKAAQKLERLRGGRHSDAILSCPCCFTSICIECQQHAAYHNQFRAMLVMNCRVDTTQIVDHQGRGISIGAMSEEDSLHKVFCAACDAHIGFKEIKSAIYHFIDVLASAS